MRQLVISLLFLIQFTSLFAQTHLDLNVTETQTLIQDNQSNQDFVILDVRTKSSFLTGHIDQAQNLDYYSSTFRSDLDQLDKNLAYLVYCQSGGRGSRTIGIMQELGFQQTYHLEGGMNAWNAANLDVVTNVYGLEAEELMMYPNPASTIVYFNETVDSFYAEVYSASGQLVKIAVLNMSTLDVSDLLPGLYFVKVKTATHEWTKRLIVSN